MIDPGYIYVILIYFAYIVPRKKFKSTDHCYYNNFRAGAKTGGISNIFPLRKVLEKMWHHTPSMLKFASRLCYKKYGSGQFKITRTVYSKSFGWRYQLFIMHTTLLLPDGISVNKFEFPRTQDIVMFHFPVRSETLFSPL